MPKITLVALTFLLSAMTFAAQASETQIIKSNYDDILLNNTILGETPNGRWKVFHKKEGQRVFYSATGFADDGKIWFSESGEACTKWNKLRSGATHCSKLFISGEILTWIEADGKKVSAKLRKGDYSGWD